MKKLFALLTALLLTSSCSLAAETEWIAVADNALIPDESVWATAYPASITPGEQLYDLNALLGTLLGEDYMTVERTQYSHKDEYRSTDGTEPWEYRRVWVHDDDRAFEYGNPQIISERGAEYEPSALPLTPDERLSFCRALLGDVVPTEWTEHVRLAPLLLSRWDYSDRWMTEEEFAAFCAGQDHCCFSFEHRTEAGLPILADRVYACIGADGLASVEICWRDYTPSEKSIFPMPLKEAVELANSTREAPCTLLCAELVYSDWLTGDGTQNLSWYLTTDAGNYVVDCVLKKHLCDSYEY